MPTTASNYYRPAISAATRPTTVNIPTTTALRFLGCVSFKPLGLPRFLGACWTCAAYWIYSCCAEACWPYSYSCRLRGAGSIRRTGLIRV